MSKKSQATCLAFFCAFTQSNHRFTHFLFSTINTSITFEASEILDIYLMALDP